MLNVIVMHRRKKRVNDDFQENISTNPVQHETRHTMTTHASTWTSEEHQNKPKHPYTRYGKTNIYICSSNANGAFDYSVLMLSRQEPVNNVRTGT